MHDLGTRLSS